MMSLRATKLNAQVQLTNLQAMYERPGGAAATRTSEQRRQLDLEYQDCAAAPRRRLQRHTAGGRRPWAHAPCGLAA